MLERLELLTSLHILQIDIFSACMVYWCFVSLLSLPSVSLIYKLVLKEMHLIVIILVWYFLIYIFITCHLHIKRAISGVQGCDLIVICYISQFLDQGLITVLKLINIYDRFNEKLCHNTEHAIFSLLFHQTRL